MRHRALAMSVAVSAIFGVAAIMCAGLAAEPSLRGQTVQRLPASVRRVAFGARYETQAYGGGRSCTIKEPLTEPPAFPAGTTEITFLVKVDPDISLDVSVIGDLGSRDMKGEGCDAYQVVFGAMRQTQYGRTISRLDGKPLQAGVFKLRLEIGAKQYDVPFEIKSLP